MREMICVDDNWKFHKEDFISVRNRWAFGKSGAFLQGPEAADFNDTAWENVSIPHDYVFESGVSEDSSIEFDENHNVIPAMDDVKNMHTTAGSRNRDIGWYRKHFFIPKEYEGKKLYLIFDGIYRMSTFYLNKFYMGSERSGYKRIVVDITDVALYGEENVLSVRVDPRVSEGWFYEGGGIYRHVWLQVLDQLHIKEKHIRTKEDSVQVDIRLSEHKSPLTISAEIYDKEGKLTSKAEIYDNDGNVTQTDKISDKEVNPTATTEEKIGPNTNECSLKLTVKTPRLWSVESPYLYTLRLTLKANGQVIDEVEEQFGFRKIRFDCNEGFFLNEKSLKIKGVCCHQNHGGLGTALPDEIMRFRIKKLKEMGANAYRCSHYPMSETFFKICDEEGMLVMAENRLFSSEEGDLSQLESLVKIARNHPCLMLYSIGNEEVHSQDSKQSGRIAQTMINLIRSLDEDTPVTMALLTFDLRNRTPIEDTTVLEKISSKLDVAGFNYQMERWDKYHKTFPNQPFLCTEQGTFKSTIGCYKTDVKKCHLAITDKSQDSYMKGEEQWQAVLKHWNSGLFIWTGFDYYGEPTPFSYPAVSSQFGAMDLCGNPKDFYYFYQAWWTDKKVLHTFPDMNITPGENVDYYVFSNADEVEIFINGRSIGRKIMERNSHVVFENQVAESGTMKVVGYRKNEEDQIEIIKTNTKAAASECLEKEFEMNDIVVYRLALLDEEKKIVKDHDIEYKIPNSLGVLLGASNGDPSYHFDGKSGSIKTFKGLAQIIVRKSKN